MTCCTPSRVANTTGGPAAAQPPGLLSPTPVVSAPRARFGAAKTFVGTAGPVIPEDGEAIRRVTLRAFELELTAVTNARFSAFVAATGYVTEAERFGWSPVFRGLLPPGAAFVPSAGPTPWWVRVDGACWNAPEGPLSDIAGRMDHPVVQVSWNDANAFAGWAGGRLPSEAEWEHAARGGLRDPRFPWGDDEPDDRTNLRCNIWQGEFPALNTAADGYLGTSPADAFAPNGAGLFSMAGNVWEWTADAFRIRSLSRQAKLRNEQGAKAGDKVVKGGSFLCHRIYCYRYRIAARSSMSAESSTSNAGFRLAFDAA